jgi:hypothetical protein
LEWLATVLDAYGRQSKWISTLQDFNFKIQHQARSRHINVDVLNHNLINVVEKNENLQEEIQDYKLLQTN